MGEIIRDILDKQLVDRHQRNMGKVDGIVLELRDGQPPRLAYLKVGGTTLARRLHPRLAQWLAALERKLGIGRGEPFRIPWSKVRDIGIDVEVDLDVEQTPILAWEQWLSKHVIRRIPGA
jgi:sporulation protein YlmC with PRC-barrel domain